MDFRQFSSLALVALSVLLGSVGGFASELEIPSTILTEERWEEIHRNDFLPQGQYPETQAFLDHWGKKLNAGLDQVLREDFSSPLPIKAEFLVNTKTEVNASASLVRAKNGSYKLKIVVQRGLLHHFLKNQGPEALRSFLGVLAHELGHSVDLIDATGISNAHRFQRGDSQAREIRADFDAVRILRAAGLQDDGMLLALEKIAALDSPNNTWLNGLMGSHPQTQARLSAHRMALTVFRAEQGDGLAQTPAALSKQQWEKLNGEFGLPQAKRHLVPVLKEDISVLVARIESLFGLADQAWLDRTALPNLSAEKDIQEKYCAEVAQEIWSRLVALDRQIIRAENSGQILPAEKKMYQKLMVDILRRDLQLEWSRLRLKDTNLDSPQIRRDRSTHTQLIQSIAALHEQSYLDEIQSVPGKDRFQSILSGSLQFKQLIFERVLPVDVQWELAERHLQPDQLTRAFSELTQNRGLSPPERKIALRILSNIRQQNNLGAIFKNRAEDFWPRRSLPIEPPFSALEWEEIKAAAKHIWDRRGLYALTDLVTHSPVDWTSVLKILEIPRSQGLQQIGDAAIAQSKFTRLLQLPSEVLPPMAFGGGDRPWLTMKVTLALQQDSSSPTHAVESAYRLLPEKLKQRAVQETLVKLTKSGLPQSKWTVPYLIDALSEQLSLEKLLHYQDRGWVEYWAADWIAENMSRSVQKNRLLRELLLGPEGKLIYAGANGQIPGLKLKLLKKIQLTPSVIRFLHADMARLRKKTSAVEEFQMMPRAVVHVIDEIAQELSVTTAIADVQKALDLLERMIDSAAFVGYRERQFRILTILAEKAIALDLRGDEARLFHRRLSELGPTPASDHLYEKLSKEKIPLEEAANWLRTAQLYSEKLRVRNAERILEQKYFDHPELLALDFDDSLDDLMLLLPKASPERDALLERMLWASRMRDGDSIQLIENQKTTSLRALDPSWVDIFSQSGELLVQLPERERLELAQYLMQPERREFPSSVQDFYSESLESKLKTQNLLKLIPNRFEDLKAELRRSFIKFAEDSSPLQKIPAFEILLAGGESPLVLSEKGRVQVLRELLGKSPNSADEKALLAYLDVVPREERSVALAYLLAHHREGETDVNAIAAAFKTVGFKFGQQGALWKLFGEKGSARAALLKDQAEPLTMKEITATLKSLMPLDEWSKIARVERILGSASIKGAVVEVALTDGRRAVVLIRRPRIEAQVHRNLRLARELLRQAKKRGIAIDERASESLLDSIAVQLKSEIPLREEAKQIQRAQKVYAELASEFDRSGWKLQVPGLVDGFVPTDEIIVMEKAPGATFNQIDNLTAAERQRLESIVGRAAIRGLFRLGWINADPHRGQFLVDPVTRTISAIDFGQSVQLGVKPGALNSDEVHDLALWFKSLAEGKVDGVIEYGLRLSERSRSGQRAPAGLRQNVQKVIGSGSPLSSQLLELSHVFAEAGTPLKTSVSFGVLKGLATLAQEGYFAPGEFEKELRSEIQAALVRKAPRTAIEMTRQNCLRPFLKALGR